MDIPYVRRHGEARIRRFIADGTPHKPVLLLEGALILRSDQRGPSPQASHGYLPERYLFDTGVLRESAVPGHQRGEHPSAAVIENQTAIELARSGAELSGWKKGSSGTVMEFIVKRGAGGRD